MNRFVIALSASALVLIPGCKLLGPDFARPKAPVSAEYKEAPPGWKSAQPQDQALRGNWWETYRDPVLNDLVSQVSVSNQTLAQAEARYRQARALVAQARSEYFPLFDLNATSTRAKAGQGGSGEIGSRGAQNAHRIGVNASWEPDLWGRIARSVEAQAAGAQASAADIEATRLSLQADLAQSYFALRAVDSQQRLLQASVKAFEDSLKLTQNRYDAGVVARVDVVQAETQVRQTQAQAIDVGVQRAQLEHAIAVLVGKPPAELNLPRAPLDGIAPPRVPLGLPSELLERRPDISAAERRVAAANAQIGVAQAAYFPTITLSGSAGFASSTIGDLFSTPARFWSLGAALAQTLFDGGARRARVQQQVALYDETVAAYRQTVLTSFQEVEDNLASLRILEEESTVQNEALAGARRSVELALNQYKSGIVSYLNVLTAQTTALTSERTAVDLQSRRLAASVQLVRALGGGWDPSTMPTPQQVEAKPSESPVPKNGAASEGEAAESGFMGGMKRAWCSVFACKD
ncbi:MAG TPA: efflux transporter outer membrane subunit [Burkholderiales bacterium]|nr:efflux transporter outer membrane subunit [Burkholderiales bacterium]